MQKRKIFFVAAVLCFLIIGMTGFYWYHKPRTGLSDIKPDYTLSAKELYTAFQQDEQKANEQFVSKVIQVKGTVENVQATDSSLNVQLSSGDVLGGVNCSLVKDADNAPLTPSKGAVVEIKGRCIGYLMDVNLVDAVIKQ
jgi:DNA/RNA endonuclease YhcR with UshA esterase domain